MKSICLLYFVAAAGVEFKVVVARVVDRGRLKWLQH